MKIAVLGDSHTVALRLGLAELQADPAVDLAVEIHARRVLPSPDLIKPFFAELNGEVSFLDPAASEATRKVIGSPGFGPDHGDWIFAFSLGFMTTFLLNLDDWLEFAPWCSARRDRQLISDGVLRAIARRHNRYVLDFYRAIRGLGLRCVAIQAPPPMEGDRWFNHGADEPTILHLDAVFREAIEDELRALGVPTVPIPVAAFDDRGFRRSEFWSHKVKRDDRVHANAAFGRLMIPEIVKSAMANFQPDSAP